jgi:hypothetical protein
MRAKLKEIKGELWQRLHDPVPEVGKWLRSVVRGHIQYYGVPRNRDAIKQFCLQVARLWYRVLRRRSQKTRLTWVRTQRLINRWPPHALIVHPYPEERLVIKATLPQWGSRWASIPASRPELRRREAGAQHLSRRRHEVRRRMR